MATVEDNEPYLGHSLAAFDRWVADLASVGVGRDRLVLLGFSRGACLTAEYAARRPTAYRGIAILTGGVIGPVVGGTSCPGQLRRNARVRRHQ